MKLSVGFLLPVFVYEDKLNGANKPKHLGTGAKLLRCFISLFMGALISVRGRISRK